MINIVGDVIEFNGRPVALIIVPSGTLRSDMEEAIETLVSTEEYESLQEELEEALETIKKIKELCD